MRAIATAACVFVLAGCGGASEETSTPTTAPPAAGAPVPGGALSVSEAIASDLEGPLLVRGYVIERDGELRLCEAILESQPPQCGEPSLRIEGARPPASQEQASLLGEVEDRVITVSDTTIG